MTVRVASKLLVGLLKDLSHTAPDDVDAYGAALCGVLLHSERAHAGTGPGKYDLLVGTSANRYAVGHCWEIAEGTLPPMLWTIADVRSVVAVLGPKAKVGKDDPDHMVKVSAVDGMVELIEDPDVLKLPGIGSPWSMRFKLGPIDDYPRSVWFALRVGDEPLDVVVDPELGILPPLPRVDLHPDFLNAAVQVAKRRREYVQLYHRHQRRAVHVQVGENYRGTIAPQRYPDGAASRLEGLVPGAPVYDPQLPPIERQEPPVAEEGAAPDDVATVDRFEDAVWLDPLQATITTDTDADGRMATPTLLEQAARYVVEKQSGSRAALQKHLRVQKSTVGELLDALQVHGIVGPSDGATPREVLVSAEQLEETLARLRGEA